jgi:hypothetical protein
MALIIEWDGGDLLLADGKSAVLGRDPSVDISINHSKVSRHHLQFAHENGIWKIRDLDSSNGTYVSGKLIKEFEITKPIEVYVGGPNSVALQISLTKRLVGGAEKSTSPSIKKIENVVKIKTKEPSIKVSISKLSAKDEDIAENAIDWWNDLDQKTRRGVSPRRLDYALNVYVKGGDIRDVLPSNVNVSKLITELKNGSYIKLMKAVFVQRNVDEAKKFLAVRNNYDNTIQRILKSEDMIKFFIPCVKEEDLVNLMASESKVYNHTVDNLEVYDSTVKNILDVNGNSKLAKKLKKEPKLVQMVHDLKAIAINKQFTQYTFSNPNLIVKPVIKNRFSVMFGSVNGQSFSNFVKDSSSIQNALKRGTQYRTGIFHKIAANVGNAETYSDYLTALNILCNIIGSSHKDSLKSQIFQGLPELFGFLVRKTIDTSFGLETVQSILAKLKVQNGRVDKVEEFLFTNSKLYV